MSIKKSYIPTITAVSLIIIMFGYFAYNFVFYNFTQQANGYTMDLNGTNEATDGLYFSYENNEVLLNYSASLQQQDIDVYALRINGVTQMTQDNMKNMSSDYVGSFAATLPVQSIDVDGDGQQEKVYLSAKTDMEFTQGYMPNPPTFQSNLFPFEVIFSDRTTISVQYNGEPIAKGQITVVTQQGEQTYTTDANGVIEGLDVRDIRKGIAVTYRSAQKDIYTMHYQVEDNTLFGLRHLSAMMPFIMIVLVSAVGIVICHSLRKRIIKNDPVAAKFYDKRAISVETGASGNKEKFGFMTIRWICMIGSLLLLVYGTQIVGQRFAQIAIPVFSCPINQDQLIESSCYYLSHLDVLFTLPWQDILMFIASFVISLILLGRIICGFICPLGLIQDIVHEIRQALKIEGISLNEKLYNALKPIKWVLVLLFLGLCFVGGNFCDFCPAITQSPAFAGFKVSVFMSGFVMVIVIIGSFFKRRFWCTVCPLGYIMGNFHKISLFRLKKDCTACTECGACYEACPMGIKSIYTQREKEDVTTTDCIMCGECVKKCPENNGLSMTCMGKKFYKASRKTFMSGYESIENKINQNTIEVKNDGTKK